MGPVVADRPLVPLGFNQVEVTTSVKSLPTPVGESKIPADASYAYIQSQGGLLRWRDDGTDPDGSTGHLINDTDDLWYIANINKFRFIKETSEVATVYLTVSYYKVS